MPTARKLPSGSWNCRLLSHYEYKKMPDGTTKKVRINQSFTCDDPSPAGKKKCEAEAAAWAYARKEKRYRIRIYDAVNQYIESQSNILSASTIRAYKKYLDNQFGDISDEYVNSITRFTVQQWVNGLAAKYSGHYVRNIYALFTPAMEMFDGPKYKITLPPKVAAERYVPTDDEVVRFIDYIKKKNDTDLLLAVMIAGFCSLRRSEVCALTDKDVRSTGFWVSKAMVQDSENSWVVNPFPKTKKPRLAHAPDFLLDMVKDIKGNIVKLNPGALSRRYDRAIRSAKMDNRFSIHDLRHYYVSISHTLGIPDQYIMDNGGWRTDNVMKRVYRDSLADVKSQEEIKLADHFSELIEGKKEPQK